MRPTSLRRFAERVVLRCRYDLSRSRSYEEVMRPWFAEQP